MPSPLDVCPGERDYARLLFVASLLICTICISCGVVGSDPVPPPPASVSVQSNSPQVVLGGAVQFSAIVRNASSSAVAWSIVQANGANQNMGTVDSSGLYTAPGALPTPASVTAAAALQADPSVSGSASVAIQSSLTLSPARTSIVTPQTLQLDVTNASIALSDVTWSASSGTISPTGLYTPPSAPGTYTIRAALNANSNVTGQATIYVTDFPGTLTWRNDNSRSGENKWELELTPGPPGSPGAVSPSTFGKLFCCPIDGYAYAQPLYVPNLTISGLGTHNVILVATEYDSIFAFDADANTCNQLWKTSLVPVGSEPVELPTLYLSGADIVPFVGITGTPVIDGRSLNLYAVAATQIFPTDPSLPPTYSEQLYKLDLRTVPPPIQPRGIEITSPDFSPAVENQRPALLLDNAKVYIAFGSYGGQCPTPIGPGPCPYHGWLFAYDSASLVQIGAFNVTSDTIRGGIWQSGGGPSADSNGNVFVVTGAGPFNANRGLSSYSNSFLRFGTADGLSKVADYFTPCDQAALQTAGLDVGASAPVLVLDSPSQPNLLIGGSMNGSLYVINPYSMGGILPNPCPNLTAPAQTIPLGVGPIMSTPLYWNNAVYVAPGNSNLMSFSMSGGNLAAPPPAFQSKQTLGPQGATPVISSNGTNNAVLWVIDTSGAQTWPAASGPAILRAYDPNNLSNEIYSSPTDPSSHNTAGPAVKFTVPTVANGKVYVGTQTELDVYGLLQ